MPRCLICREEILPESKRLARNVEGETAEAHEGCVAKLRALLEIPSMPAQAKQKGPAAAIVEKIGDDWMLVRRDLPNSALILAYLEKQDSPCDVKSIYEWLRRNELGIKNPSDYIQKMKKSGLVAVMNSDTARLVKITDKGLKILQEPETQAVPT